MEFIVPHASLKKPVVLTDLFPFNRLKESKGLSSASLKLECLIQEECTVPGSLVLEDEGLRELIRTNIELVESGALVLDLRNTAKSYNDLVDTKYGVRARYDLREMADLLDDACKTVIHFDASNTSSLYKNSTLKFLHWLKAESQTGHERRAVDKLIRYLESIDNPSFSDISNLRTNIKKIDGQIFAVAKYLYCTCGSQTVNGIAEVPHSLWQQVHRNPSSITIDAASATDQTDLTAAHSFILEHFAVDSQAFGRLTARDIVNLRRDGATRRTLKSLRDTIEMVRTEILDTDGPRLSTMEQLAEYRAKLSQEIAANCLQDAKKGNRSEFQGLGVDEVISLGAGLLSGNVPFIGLGRKGVLASGRVLSRQHEGLASLDITRSPISTYVNRIQDLVRLRPQNG